jgi:hypothetical protein
MTHTVTVKETTVFGNKVVKIASIDVTSYTTGGEVVNASSFGISTINAVMVVGNEEPVEQTVVAEADASGDYASSSSFHLFATSLDGTNGEAPSTTDIGAIRVMVVGHR